MKKLISVSVLLFCFALLSAQNKDQTKKQVTPQKKVQVKTQATPQKKVQAKPQVTPQNKGQVKNEAISCQWQKNEADPFTGESAKTTSWEVVGYNAGTNTAINNGITGAYNFAVSENIQKKDTAFMLLIRTSTSQSLCLNKDSKILIKSGETILTINFLGGPQCGKNITSSGILDKDTRKFLRKHPVDLLRIQFYSDNNAIINVDLKNVDTSAKLDSDYFIKTLKCFE
jgi:hypothetical protein